MRVRGEGPTPADIMIVGEAPGWEEEKTGRPFVGKSGRELTRYLTAAGVDRSQCYVTNIVKLRPPFLNGKQHAPTAAEIKANEPELVAEIVKTEPKWIAAIGRVAAQWFLGSGLDMESTHGLAYPWQRAGEHGCSGPPPMVVPIYHPAAALHNPEIAPLVDWDIRQFGAYASGRLHPQVPADQFYGVEDYQRTDRIRWDDGVELVAVDTEGLVNSPWGLSASIQPGSARVLHYPFGVDSFPLDQASRIIMHNSPHDVPVLAAMGVPVDWDKVEDTFLMAYCLRVVPMGLKGIARRFLGMAMTSYREVVGPADERLMVGWVERALAANLCPCCDGEGKVNMLRKDGKGLKKGADKCPFPGCHGGWLYSPREGWSVGQYLRRLQTDITNAVATAMDGGAEPDEDEEDGASDLRRRVQNWPEDVLEPLQAAAGPIPHATLDDVPEETSTFYSARDADATLRAYPILRDQLRALDLEQAYRLDLSVMPTAVDMMQAGMHIDVGYFENFSRELKKEKAELLDKLAARVGRRINPMSGDQVAELLFGGGKVRFDPEDELEFGSAVSFDLIPEKYTKSQKRGATDDKVLEGLKLKYSHDPVLVETIDLILDYRQRDKIDGTYASKLPRMADKNSRIHTEIKPCRTATFRWASANPNLQNIPIREKNGVDLGKRVRQGFTAPSGRVLGSWDFDQIEMRVLAWFSQDENLLNLFEGLRNCPEARAGSCSCHDIHRLTASLVFRVPKDQVTKAQRTSAKNIGFGVVYGVTPKGLKAQMELRGLHWTLEECEALINSYLHEAYPGVGRFMMDAHAEARSTGMVRSYFGHLRYVPNVHSSISSIREEALRQAANFKIQCTAAELLKVVMRDLRAAKPILDVEDIMLLMAVHDELLTEQPDTSRVRTIADTIIASYMTNPVRLDGVHVGTSGKFAYNWGELK